MSIKLKDGRDFSKRLILLGLSQRGFAKKIGTSGPFMCNIINGNRNPSAEMAKKICVGLDVSFEDIFFIQEDNKSYQMT